MLENYTVLILLTVGHSINQQIFGFNVIVMVTFSHAAFREIVLRPHAEFINATLVNLVVLKRGVNLVVKDRVICKEAHG